MGRLVCELLIRENVNVTVTLREYKNGAIQVPDRARTVGYSERYKAIAGADIVVSATTSPHYTLRHDDLRGLARLPGFIVDLAVPRDVEPSVVKLPGVNMLGLDDISGESHTLPPESVSLIEEIIGAHVEKFDRWRAFKNNKELAAIGGMP